MKEARSNSVSTLLHPLLLLSPSFLGARNTTLECLHVESHAHIFHPYSEAQALFHVHQDVRRIGAGTHKYQSQALTVSDHTACNCDYYWLSGRTYTAS